MLQRVGKYEIKRLLGKGATGTVYVAADPFGQRDVAIKVFDATAADDEERRRQLRFFQTEAALAGKLRHPHIVSIFDAGVENTLGGEPLRYLVMELVEGSALSTRCEPGALLDPARVVEIGYKCCKALEFANGLGVVHRDIKPANILMRADHDIKLSDFGAAQIARAEVTQVSGVGSPAYMSPEQLKGEELDYRTDMFSLGGVLYHLLTGRRAFDGNTAYELIESILGTTPTPPSRLRNGVSPALDEILVRAMAKTRDERYASWEEFGGAVSRLLKLEGGSAGLTDADKFAAARRLRFFERFEDADLWHVVRASVWRHHAAGSELIREGSTNESFFVLASGLAMVTQRGAELNAVRPGECVGEMAYARRDHRPRSATVTAVEPSWAIGLRAQDVDALPERCRGRFNEALLVIMAERLSMLGDRLLAERQETQ